MTSCGHRCCSVPHNRYHTHTDPPATCRHCAAAAVAAGETAPAVTLGRVIADVLARVAPAIHGLPEGRELAELVAATALRVYAEGETDPDLQALDARDRRSVLAARVGLALAFPHD